MNQEIYEDWKKSSHEFEYTFSSVGPKGEVSILVQLNPEKIICFTGSMPARTRLYRMIISLNLEELSQDFIIFGELDQSPDCWEEFQKGRSYVSFAIKRKVNNLHI